MSTARAAPVLVVGPAWVGDLVMAEPLLRLLGERDGAPPVDLLIPPHLAPLAARMPGLRRVHQLPAAHGELAIGLRRRIGRALRSAGYAQAIVLPNSFKSALVPWFARIPLRTGWRGEMRYGLLNDLRHPSAMPMLQVERFAVLGRPVMRRRSDAARTGGHRYRSWVRPCTAATRVAEIVPDDFGIHMRAQAPGTGTVAPPGDAIRSHNDFDRNAIQPRLVARDASELFARLGIGIERRVLALCPGADYGPAKRWPAAHFAAVAAARIDAGWQVWLIGGANDAAITREIRDRLEAREREHCRDLAGRTTLGEAVDLLACAAAVLSNDTGLMHIAAALDRPLLAIYGSSSAQFTPPLGARAVVLSPAIACAPCYARECRFGHYRCLAEHTPQRVLQRLDDAQRLAS